MRSYISSGVVAAPIRGEVVGLAVGLRSLGRQRPIFADPGLYFSFHPLVEKPQYTGDSDHAVYRYIFARDYAGDAVVRARGGVDVHHQNGATAFLAVSGLGMDTAGQARSRHRAGVFDARG